MRIILIYLIVIFYGINIIECSKCHFEGYKSTCKLEIAGEHIVASATINHCHDPVDITFYVTYQYENETNHDWEYTFVTTNQNERIPIPGLHFPVAPGAPVYLYARVPTYIFDLHNSSLAAITASFVATVPEHWEEAEFLDEVIFINTKDDCTLKKEQTSPLLPWIIGGTVASIVLTLLALGFVCWYKKHKLSLDELALVSSLDAGIPGAQPYQMGELNQPNQSNDTQQKPNEIPVNGTNHAAQASSSGVTANTDQADSQPKSGRKGFRFGRLKEEDPEEMRERAVAVCDKSVIIGNPLFMKDNAKKKKSSNVIMNKNIRRNSNAKTRPARDPATVKYADETRRESADSAEHPDHAINAITNHDANTNYAANTNHQQEIVAKNIVSKTNSNGSDNSRESNSSKRSDKSGNTEDSTNSRSKLRSERHSSDSNHSNTSNESNNLTHLSNRDIPNGHSVLHPLQDRFDEMPNSTTQGARPKLKKTLSKDSNRGSKSHTIQIAS